MDCEIPPSAAVRSQTLSKMAETRPNTIANNAAARSVGPIRSKSLGCITAVIANTLRKEMDVAIATPAARRPDGPSPGAARRAFLTQPRARQPRSSPISRPMPSASATRERSASKSTNNIRFRTKSQRGAAEWREGTYFPMTGFGGLLSSPRSGSPQPAKMTLRTASRNRTTSANSLPFGSMGDSMLTLMALHRGNH
jgi:hypothetical protein